MATPAVNALHDNLPADGCELDLTRLPALGNGSRSSNTRTLLDHLQSAIAADCVFFHLECDDGIGRVRQRCLDTTHEFILQGDTNGLLDALKTLQQALPQSSATDPAIRQGGVILGRFRGTLTLQSFEGLGGQAYQIELQRRRREGVTLDSLGAPAGQARRIRQLCSEHQGLIALAGAPNTQVHSLFEALIRERVCPQTRIVAQTPFQIAELPRVTQIAALDDAQRSIRSDVDVLAQHQSYVWRWPASVQAKAQSRTLVVQCVEARCARDVLSQYLANGYSPQWLAANLNAIVVQTDVRQLCTECRQPARPDASQQTWLQQMGPKASSNVQAWLQDSLDSGYSMASADGCERCDYSGHSEPISLFSVSETSTAVRQALSRNDPVQALDLIEPGWVSTGRLLELSRSGVLSLNEAMRVHPIRVGASVQARY